MKMIIQRFSPFRVNHWIQTIILNKILAIDAANLFELLNNETKDLRQKQWQAGEFRVMVATNAFGMGIDKADVRLVVHVDLPDSPEAYFQEAGRAGRDGKKAYAVILYSKSDKATLNKRVSDTFPEKEYIKQIYHEIKDEYTPVLKHMTRTQGKVLLKLIDRETEYTAYEVLKEFRGGFVAGFWQGVSRIFGQNLKSQYDKDNEDKMIEQIVIYYEAGLLR